MKSYDQKLTQAHERIASHVAGLAGIDLPDQSGVLQAVNEPLRAEQYGAMVQLNLQPEVVVYPVGLSAAQWSDLLADIPLQCSFAGLVGSDTRGLCADDNVQFSLQLAETQQKTWGVAVVSGRADPRTIPLESRYEVPRTATLEQYLGLQLVRILGGEPPVDYESSTAIHHSLFEQPFAAHWDGYKQTVSVTVCNTNVAQIQTRPAVTLLEQ